MTNTTLFQERYTSTTGGIEYIDNPYNGQLQILGMDENYPVKGILTLKFNQQEIYQGEIAFKNNTWSTLRIVIPKSAMKIGLNNFSMQYHSSSPEKNKRLLIREVKLLY